jgi:hypothetical protein
MNVGSFLTVMNIARSLLGLRTVDHVEVVRRHGVADDVALLEGQSVVVAVLVEVGDARDAGTTWCCGRRVTRDVCAGFLVSLSLEFRHLVLTVSDLSAHRLE